MDVVNKDIKITKNNCYKVLKTIFKYCDINVSTIFLSNGKSRSTMIIKSKKDCTESVFNITKEDFYEIWSNLK